MVKSQDVHNKPIMGLHVLPFRETGLRDFGLYPWWAFCTQGCATGFIRSIFDMENQASKPEKKFYKRWWFWVAIIVVVVYVDSKEPAPKPAQTQETPQVQPAPVPTLAAKPVASSRVGVGEDGMLNYHSDIKDCSQETIVSLDVETEKAVIKASIANDTYGMAEVVSSGKAFLVSNCTKVKVIDQNVGSRKIRILEGEQLSKSGWVPMEFVKK